MVGIQVGPIFYSIGTGSFLHCFCSTIAVRLENGNWGSRFPTLMHKLYKAEVTSLPLDLLQNELKTIQAEFASLHPDQVIWAIEDRSKQPPWGTNIADTITDLSNYFLTSDGKNLFEVFFTAIDASQRVNRDLVLRSL